MLGDSVIADDLALRTGSRIADCMSWRIEKGLVKILGSRFAILNCTSAARVSVFLLSSALFLSCSLPFSLAQTVGTGSVAGTITDPKCAVGAGAKVDITNKATSAVIQVTSSPAGAYTSGPIVPGDYVVRIEAKGFKTASLPLVVQVGN